MTVRSIKAQNLMSNDSATIKGKSDFTRLSSDSLDIEKENVAKFMNYKNGYFSYIRLGQEGTCRYCENIDSAYKYALRECETRLKEEIYGSRVAFFVTDSGHVKIFEGEPKRNGKIKFSIYNGNASSYLATITDEYNKSFLSTNTNIMKQTNLTTDTQTLINSEDADCIKSYASTFINRNILSEYHVKFLCLSRDSARRIAKTVQETAIINKDKDNETFVKAIHTVSENMITITKKLASGRPTDSDHCSMHDDLLYCAAHCKSKDSLFNGSSVWRKTPGKLNYNKLEDSIMDMYGRGRKMLIDVSGNTCKESTIISEEKKVYKQTSGSFDYMIQALISTIMVYTTSSEDVLFYMKMKGGSLESEVKSLTNNVVSASINDKTIILRTISGISKELNICSYTDENILRNEIRTIITQLIVCTALSSKTRTAIADVVDITSIEKYVSTSFNLAA